MCLIKTHRFPKISSKPIKVYKCLHIIDRKYYTPYEKVKVKLGGTIKNRHCWLKGIFNKQIRGEGVHAYTNFDKANYMVEDYIAIIVEAEIPPFTPYWIGDNSDIAASRIKLVKRYEQISD